MKSSYLSFIPGFPSKYSQNLLLNYLLKKSGIYSESCLMLYAFLFLIFQFVFYFIFLFLSLQTEKSLLGLIQPNSHQNIFLKINVPRYFLLHSSILKVGGWCLIALSRLYFPSISKANIFMTYGKEWPWVFFNRWSEVFIYKIVLTHLHFLSLLTFLCHQKPCSGNNKDCHFKLCVHKALVVCSKPSALPLSLFLFLCGIMQRL